MKEFIIVLTEGEAEAVVAALETQLLQPRRDKSTTVIRDWKSTIAKIKREQRGGE